MCTKELGQKRHQRQFISTAKSEKNCSVGLTSHLFVTFRTSNQIIGLYPGQYFYLDFKKHLLGNL